MSWRSALSLDPEIVARMAGQMDELTIHVHPERQPVIDSEDDDAEEE